MDKLVLLKRRENGRLHHYRLGDLRISPGDYCVIEAERGLDYGQVISEPELSPEEEREHHLHRVVRKATPGDMEQIVANRDSARESFQVCQKKIVEKQLPMKLVQVEYSFDRSRLLFYFTAEGRIDFRELVKDLAGIFKTRIEMRQIGVRDEAKMLGGIGPCGRELCCAAFIRTFEPVNIRMAKIQRLPLDPDKISGVCGRLFCCLRYEEEFYCRAARKFPRDGTEVATPQGEGKVIDLNFLGQTVSVEMKDDRKLTFPLSEIKKEVPDRDG